MGRNVKYSVASIARLISCERTSHVCNRHQVPAWVPASRHSLFDEPCPTREYHYSPKTWSWPAVQCYLQYGPAHSLSLAQFYWGHGACSGGYPLGIGLGVPLTFLYSILKERRFLRPLTSLFHTFFQNGNLFSKKSSSFFKIFSICLFTAVCDIPFLFAYSRALIGFSDFILTRDK